MPENRDIRGKGNTLRVAADQDRELDQLRRKFGVTTSKVLDAIRAVGYDKNDIENYLRDQMGGYHPRDQRGEPSS
jgi:hypothetical protein